MTVHVDELSTTVTAETDSPAVGASTPAHWEELASIRAAQAQIARDRRRTAAEDYDD